MGWVLWTPSRRCRNCRPRKLRRSNSRPRHRIGVVPMGCFVSCSLSRDGDNIIFPYGMASGLSRSSMPARADWSLATITCSGRVPDFLNRSPPPPAGTPLSWTARPCRSTPPAARSSIRCSTGAPIRTTLRSIAYRSTGGICVPPGGAGANVAPRGASVGGLCGSGDHRETTPRLRGRSGAVAARSDARVCYDLDRTGPAGTGG